MKNEMTTKEYLSKHDREIASIRTLLKQGMKMLVEFQEENRKFHREARTAVLSIQKSQKELIDSLKRTSNGYRKGKV